MKLHSTTHAVPQVFEELDRYNFSKLHIRNDFALGVSHSIKITFELQDSNKEYNTINHDGNNPNEFSVLAIPTYDGYSIKDVDDVITEIAKLNKSDIKVMNDFDIPWVN